MPAVGAGLMVHCRTFLEELWVGGYLAYVALGCYSAALLVDVAWRRAAGRKKSGP